jgi:hypothetical protein
VEYVTLSRTSNLTDKSPEEVAEALNREDTINQAAIALRVAPGTLYRYIRNNKLKRETIVLWTVQPKLVTEPV